MKPKDYQKPFADDSSSAGRCSVGGFPLILLLAATIMGIGLAIASAREVSHSRAIANNWNCTRASLAADVSEPAREGKTGSKSVRGNGQTSHVSITELRFFGTEAMDQLKTAVIAREVATTE